MMRFTEFPLTIELLEALHEMRFHRSTPIQERVIPIVLSGKDVSGMAQTGTGKTLAFLVPILNMLRPDGHTQALVVCPTRELALQVGQVASELGGKVGVKTAVIYGGTALGSQRKEVYTGPDIIVGTPGRLIEFIQTGVIRMRHLRWLVLDEADRMLDMGFIDDVDIILRSCPPSRQTMLFSATLPPPIMKIASQYMHDPVQIQVSPPTLLADRVVQLAYRVPRSRKDDLIVDLLRGDPPSLCLVFTATREATTDVARRLRAAGFEAGSLSSLQSQRTRESIVRMFKEGEFKILVATDVAGRGLDITGISHVVNYDAPMDPEDYVHRIGRTARAGREGKAITLISTDQDERRFRAIQALTRMTIPLGEHRLATGTLASSAEPDRHRGGGRREGGERREGRGERDRRGGRGGGGGPAPPRRTGPVGFPRSRRGRDGSRAGLRGRRPAPERARLRGTAEKAAPPGRSQAGARRRRARRGRALRRRGRRIVTPESIAAAFDEQGFVCSPDAAVSLFLSESLGKPLLLEGPPGVGKTEIAKLWARFHDAPLIRLQCYEGLDESKALYEWSYGKQMLYAQLLREKVGDLLRNAGDLHDAMGVLRGQADEFFSQDFLLPRPLLAAITSKEPSVLLIDEVDRSDEEFEAFLLEVLSDAQVSIPELGTLRAKHPLRVILTSNNTRDLSDALRRRCLYLFVDYPTEEQEARIVEKRVPGLGAEMTRKLIRFVEQVRKADVRKAPGISESIDWAAALALVGADSLSKDVLQRTLGALLKNRDDVDRVLREAGRFR